jgi:hypothetical protein
MRIFWKVHKDCFGEFIRYIKNKYIYFDNDNLEDFIYYYRDFYDDDDNDRDMIYLCVGDGLYGSKNKYYHLSHCGCSLSNYSYLVQCNWVDMGTFYSRKHKLERLNEISK